MTLLCLLLSLSLAADKRPPPPSPKKGNTLKEVIKDSSSASTADRDGGTDQVINGIDLSKLPFTTDSIKQVVLSYQPRVQGCHEEAMAGSKPIGGLVKVAFTITPEGFVKSAKVDKRGSTIKDEHLHDCLVSVVSAMNFPKPPDGKDHPIEFPFNLKPVE